MIRLLLFFYFFFSSFSYSISEELNLFTSRHYESDLKVFEKFSKKTGIKINVITGKSKVLEKRILEEGKKSKADILLLADAGALYSAQQKNLFTKHNSSYLNSLIPKSFRNEYWVGITKRARILFYNPSITKKSDIENISYESLSDDKWKNSIAIRQANNVYNQSLIASLIEYNGLENVEKWLKKFVKNFVRPPQGNDRAQILLVASGDAKLAVANTYYYALMLSGKKGKEQQKAAMNVKPIFPNQKGRGAHINISGAGILNFSQNKKNALKFIEFLLLAESQAHISNNSFEFPILENIQTNDLIKKISGFKGDNKIDVEAYGKRQAQAFKLMKKAGWN